MLCVTLRFEFKHEQGGCYLPCSRAYHGFLLRDFFLCSRNNTTMIMMSVVVLMGISFLYFNVITSLLMIQQIITCVCRRTNHYFVAFKCARMSSFLLQGWESIHPARRSPPYMECFQHKKSSNSDITYRIIKYHL